MAARPGSLLLVDTTDTSYTLPSAQVPNGPQARLKIVANDGFVRAEAIVSFALNNPFSLQAVYPANNTTDAGPGTSISVALRDPLDPATVNASTFFVRDGQGQIVTGTLEYLPEGYTIVFQPGHPLAAAGTLRGAADDGCSHAGWPLARRGLCLAVPSRAGASDLATAAAA